MATAPSRPESDDFEYSRHPLAHWQHVETGNLRFSRSQTTSDYKLASAPPASCITQARSTFVRTLSPQNAVQHEISIPLIYRGSAWKGFHSLRTQVRPLKYFQAIIGYFGVQRPAVLSYLACQVSLESKTSSQLELPGDKPALAALKMRDRSTAQQFAAA